MKSGKLTLDYIFKRLLLSWIVKAKLLIFCFILLYFQALYSQDNPVATIIEDTTELKLHEKQIEKGLAYYDWRPYNPAKTKWLYGITASLYTGSMIGLNHLWYADYPKSKFHWYNDNKQWLQIDKIGHTYSAYVESLLFLRALEWSGVEHKKAAWIAGGFGFLAQTVIEVLDGFSAEWGASSGDLIANTLGSAIVTGQELIWAEQKLAMKWSFHPVNYPSGSLSKRAHELYGNKWYESFLKDYNGQTYWITTSIGAWKPKSKYPKWIALSIGYGAEQMYGGDDNTWDSNNDGIRDVNRNDIPRLRQFYLTFDVDLNRIETKNPLLKKALILLNIIKVPFPTLSYSNDGKFRFHPIYF